jgi:hypothetical protein
MDELDESLRPTVDDELLLPPPPKMEVELPP